MKASVILFFVLPVFYLFRREERSPIISIGLWEGAFFTHLTIVDAVTPTRRTTSFIGILSDSSSRFGLSLCFGMSALLYITACVFNKLVRKAAALTSIYDLLI